MTTGVPQLTSDELDGVRRLAGGSAAPGEIEALTASGIVRDGLVHPTVAAVAGTFERSWASVRLRRWCRGERVDLVMALGPGGVALVAGPPGREVRRDIDHRPRWTSAARSIARFVSLGPSTGEAPLVPTRAAWSELVAAAGREVPAWAPAADAEHPTLLWDLAWRPTSGAMPPHQMTFLDLGGAAVVEVRPHRDHPSDVALRQREPRHVWAEVCRLLADIVEARTQASSPDGGEASTAEAADVDPSSDVEA